MMLHRHFEKQNARENMTTLADVSNEWREFKSDLFPPVAETEEEKPKRTKRTKTEDK